MKICGKCKKTKPLSEFYKNLHSADGHVNLCKNCKAGYDVARYSKNAFNSELLKGWTR